MTETNYSSPSPAFAHALRLILRPIVRVVLSQGIPFAYLSELLKSILVEEANQNFRLDKKSPTDSRISLLTGVHRKDVNRLRNAVVDADTKLPSKVSLGGQLVAQWLGNDQYLDEKGQPKPLPRYKSEGGLASFEALVMGVNSDIRSRVVLDEWTRLGVVHIDEEKRVCLNTQAFIPSKGFDEKAFYFGHNLHDHAAASAHNLMGLEPPFMERSVHYTGLSTETINQLTAETKELGMKALLAVNKLAMEREKIDAVSNTPRHRMTFGIYFYAESEETKQTK
jgi:Family of unknown function (DUF6502)